MLQMCTGDQARAAWGGAGHLRVASSLLQEGDCSFS
jgi:hypothetical protein